MDEIRIKTAANIVLAIVGLTVVNSTLVILFGICANVGLTFFKCPTIANTWHVGGKFKITHSKIQMTKLTSNIRRQLTLFVEPNDAIIIEQIRQEFNPQQFDIIKAHVTLCREDEIENLEQVISNLFLLTKTQQCIFIKFGKAARFDNGKGLFLPALNDNKEFEYLRRQILFGLIDNPRIQKPHITLMHPRNSTCTDKIFEQVEEINLPTKLEFRRISLIEQENGEVWKTLKDFEFKN